MEFTKYEDELLMNTVLTLESKGLYDGIDFWGRIRLKMSFDEEVEPREWAVWKYRFNYLYSLGPEMKSFEERYFDDNGEYYEDYMVPTFEEDMEEYSE